MTVVRHALSNSEIADDDDFGGDGMLISCSMIARSFVLYYEFSTLLVLQPGLGLDINTILNLIFRGCGHSYSRSTLGLKFDTTDMTALNCGGI